MPEVTSNQLALEGKADDTHIEPTKVQGTDLVPQINRVEVVAYRFVKNQYREIRYAEFKVLIYLKKDIFHVYKRYSAFESLRSDLKSEIRKQNSTIKLPKLPFKGITRSFKTEHLEERALKLNLFLQALVSVLVELEIDPFSLTALVRFFDLENLSVKDQK
eukprot:snap_masked-scaffold_14-processed-gene-6.41-mRNA-1 protein AED:1.00 eAED:1.00 QI:0/0/0/0/1/1/2/0/160